MTRERKGSRIALRLTQNLRVEAANELHLAGLTETLALTVAGRLPMWVAMLVRDQLRARRSLRGPG